MPTKEFIKKQIKKLIQNSLTYVGRKSPDFLIRMATPSGPVLNNNYFYADNLYFNLNPVSDKPYVGIVGGFKDIIDGKNVILAFGNDIDGDIAAVKKLISARTLFLSEKNLDQERVKVIDELDTTGISVADLMRDDSNFVYYTQRRSAGFANVVDRILNNNNFEIDIRTVKTYNDNTTLRLKNINSDFSANFTDVITGSTRPVVVAAGLWNNLLTLQDLGKEFAFDENNGKDAWLIEITGGPEQDERLNSPNYQFEDLVDYYWPALITGVQNYSGQKTLDYVGYSNACRVGLDSLKNWSDGKTNSGYVFDSQTGNYIESDLSSNPVDTFIGMGCPGALDGDSLFIDCFSQYGQEVLDNLAEDGNNHTSRREIGQEMLRVAGVSKCGVSLFVVMSGGEDFRISRNLGQFYLNSALSNTDTQPGQGFSLNRFAIFIGNNGFLSNNDNDYLVPVNDGLAIFNNINSSDKRNYQRFLRHSDLPKNNEIIDLIKNELR